MIGSILEALVIVLFWQSALASSEDCPQNQVSGSVQQFHNADWLLANI